MNVSFTGTPLKAGSYPVTATLNHPDYQGSANATLVIAKAQPSITFTGAPPCAAKKHAQMLAGADQVIGTLGCSSNP